MELHWVDGFTIRVAVGENEAVLSANREGMLSLARHLEQLAEMPAGCHLHLDEHNSLEEGSAELILEKTDG